MQASRLFSVAPTGTAHESMRNSDTVWFRANLSRNHWNSKIFADPPTPNWQSLNSLYNRLFL